MNFNTKIFYFVSEYLELLFLRNRKLKTKHLFSSFIVLSLCIGTAHAAKRGGQCKGLEGGSFSWEYNDVPKFPNDIRMTGKMEQGSTTLDFDLREDKSISTLSWITGDNISYHFNRGDTEIKPSLTSNITGGVHKPIINVGVGVCTYWCTNDDNSTCTDSQ